MAKADKLKTKLARHQGVDIAGDLEKKKQKDKGKKHKKQQEKRKVEKADEVEEQDEWEDESDEEEEGAQVGGFQLNGHAQPSNAAEVDRDEDDEDEEMPEFDAADIDDTDSDSELDNEEEADDEENAANLEDEEDDIPLSDLDSLASDEKGDILPHQRLTINNKPALLSALHRISLPYSATTFSAHQSITSTEPTSVPDIDDDLNRELAFYKQSLSAVTSARAQLKKEGVPFSRPVDYFAEMVKSDEHMGKIKQKLIDEAAGKKAAAEARKQRDLKKFGKQVQVAKMQERSKEKRETLEKINVLKRKRASAPIASENEASDLFDVGIDHSDSEARPKRSRADRSSDNKSKFKRASKNEKFGFGGKKRHAKSGDAASSADMRDYPGAKRMKGKAFGAGGGGGGGGGGASKRLGKSRRMKR